MYYESSYKSCNLLGIVYFFFLESTTNSLVSGKNKNNKILCAHRTVLAAASPYFNAMFTSDVVEAKRQQVQFVNTTSQYINITTYYI